MLPHLRPLLLPNQVNSRAGIENGGGVEDDNDEEGEEEDDDDAAAMKVSDSRDRARKRT